MLVDYYSKFPEIVETNTTTAAKTIQMLKQMFSRHGIPHTVVSDNGPQFSSTEYELFAAEYGFKPAYSNLLFPQINGQIERYAQTIKENAKKGSNGQI